MPSAFQRFGERMKQSLNMDAPKDWKPTSNVRVQGNLKEAQQFAQLVKRMLNDFCAMEKWSDASFSTIRAVLASRLPRVLDNNNGVLVPTSAADQTVGGNMESGQISNAALQMRQQLTSQVIYPLQQWLSAYKSIKARNEKLEALRLDVDTKKREALALAEKLTKPDIKDVPGTHEKKRVADEKLTRLETSFKETEAELFNALKSLISDAAVIKNYHAAALTIMQSSFAMARSAFQGQEEVVATAEPAGEGAPTWYAEAKANADTAAGRGQSLAYDSE